MSSNFQRARRAIESASAEHVGDILRILPAPALIPATYMPPSTYLKNGLTWSILIDHISESFVFLQGHKAGDNFHAGKYLVIEPAEWLGAEEAWRETRPGMTGLILGIFPEDALDLDTWEETSGETPLSPGVEKWNPYHEVAFADSPNGDESEGIPIPAPQWAGGTYRVVKPELTDVGLDPATHNWPQREAYRRMTVERAEAVRDLLAAKAHDGVVIGAAADLARLALALLADIAFLSPDATPAVNPVRATDQDGEA